MKRGGIEVMFGRLVLISGPEALFADRAVEALCHQMRSEAPDVEVSEIERLGWIRASLPRSPVHRCSQAGEPP